MKYGRDIVSYWYRRMWLTREGKNRSLGRVYVKITPTHLEVTGSHEWGTKSGAYQLAHKAWETRAAEIRRYSHPEQYGSGRDCSRRAPTVGGRGTRLGYKGWDSGLRGQLLIRLGALRTRGRLPWESSDEGSRNHRSTDYKREV